MSLKHRPKPATHSVPDQPGEPEAPPVQTASSTKDSSTVSLDAPQCAKKPTAAGLRSFYEKSWDQLEADLRQDLEDLRLKRIVLALDAREAQLRLAVYLEELFIEGLIVELKSLIGFLKKKIEDLPGPSSGLRIWDSRLAERTYLVGLRDSAQAKLNKLRG